MRYYYAQHIDRSTGVMLVPLDEAPTNLPDAMQINDAWYLLHRRHLTPAQLDAELRDAGFEVIYGHAKHAGSVVCVVRELYGGRSILSF